MDWYFALCERQKHKDLLNDVTTSYEIQESVSFDTWKVRKLDFDLNLGNLTLVVRRQSWLKSWLSCDWKRGNSSFGGVWHARTRDIVGKCVWGINACLVLGSLRKIQFNISLIKDVGLKLKLILILKIDTSGSESIPNPVSKNFTSKKLRWLRYLSFTVTEEISHVWVHHLVNKKVQSFEYSCFDIFSGHLLNDNGSLYWIKLCVLYGFST